MNSGTRGLMLIAIAALAFASDEPALGQTETILYSFCSQPNCADGSGPSNNSLVRDAKGNLYGATMTGGTYNLGTVFELSPSGSGWTETVLHSFSGGTADGEYPLASLILGKKGVLYGTTEEGGAYTNGIVFELSPPAKKGGAWTETILHNFGAPGDGAIPTEGVIEKDGNLYGTTYSGGGTNGRGIVYELTPSGGGWTESILHIFVAETGDGLYPGGGVVFHGKDLYGTTTYGGSDYGTVYELTPSGGGAWTEAFVYSLQQASGSYYPYAVPIFDKKGNLYGTTNGFYGSVFELTKKEVESPVYLFELIYGGFPGGVLLFDDSENLYGTTSGGGPQGAGTVFKMTLTGEITTLYSFDALGGDGYSPNGGLVFDKAGNLYGTTPVGGTGAYCPTSCGTVFEVTP